MDEDEQTTHTHVLLVEGSLVRGVSIWVTQIWTPQMVGRRQHAYSAPGRDRRTSWDTAQRHTLPSLATVPKATGSSPQQALMGLLLALAERELALWGQTDLWLRILATTFTG